MAVVLLVGAGLMIRSVRNLMALDPGFDPESVLTLRVSVPRASAPAAPAAAGRVDGPSGARRARARARSNGSAPCPASPRSRSAPTCRSTATPRRGTYAAEGMAPTNAQNVPRAYNHRISPEFFSTLRIPIVAGRTFTDDELTPTSPAVVVSERVVKRFWPGQDPIGKAHQVRAR